MLATLRIIVVANGKKLLGAILQGLVALVWVCITGVVVTNILENPFKIIAFARNLNTFKNQKSHKPL